MINIKINQHTHDIDQTELQVGQLSNTEDSQLNCLNLVAQTEVTLSLEGDR